MRARWPAPIVACLFVATVGVSAQQTNFEAARALLRRAQPLTPAQTRRVLDAVYAAMENQEFRVAGMKLTGGPTIDVQMAAGGRPRFVRTTNSAMGSVSLSEYFGRGAVSCDGHPLDGEFVVDWEWVSAEFLPSTVGFSFIWEHWLDDAVGNKIPVSARTAFYRDFLAPTFELLAGPATSHFGVLTTVDGHAMRPLIPHHELRPGDYSRDPIPAEVEDWLLFDVDTLLVRRWEVRHAGESVDYGWEFTPDDTLEFDPPNALKPPTCVEQKP